MQHKKGLDRNQLFFTSLEEMVPIDSFARVIDLVVDMLPLNDLGFEHTQLNREGNEPYHPGDLLKLLIYGQRFGVRSANRLSRSAIIHMEASWLLKGLQPSPRTICYFRTNNAEAIKNAHRHFVKMLQQWKLIDGDILALDSTKVRGQNSPNHQPNVEINNARVARYPDFYRLRQQIVEPIFGVWKRQWHFDHVLLKTKRNVKTEVTLAALTYNLIRLFNIKGRKWIEEVAKKKFNSFKIELADYLALWWLAILNINFIKMKHMRFQQACYNQ